MSTITEEQYAFVRRHLPVRRGDVRISTLTMINAILFVAENVCTWRALPPRFGNWHTVYTRMRRWADAGVLDRLFDALQEYHRVRVQWIIALGSTALRSQCIPPARPKNGL